MIEIDLDFLAEFLKTKMETGRYSLRGAAKELGCSPSTLSRLLEGSTTGITPDTVTLHQAATWMGHSLSDFESGTRPTGTTFEQVAVHLRALQGVSEPTAAAMVAAVRALYEMEQQE